MPGSRLRAAAAVLVVLGVASCSASPELDRPSTVAVAPRTAGIAQPVSAGYDAQSLLVGATFGKAGSRGGQTATLAEGGQVITIAGTTGTIAMTLYTGGDLADIQIRYQQNVTTPLDPTSVSIIPGQGFVLDGKLIVLQSVRPLNGSTLAEASILVFPASAATGLPRVPS